MWAVRLANQLVRRAGNAGLILHPEPKGQSRIGLRLDPRVKLYRCEHRFGEGADLSKVAAVYSEAIQDISPGPLILSPNLHGDCYGVAAKLSQDHDLRILGWQHSDNEYDSRVLIHYQSILSRFIAVSDAIEKLLVARPSEACARQILNIPYGIPVPPECPPRRRSQTLRLIYTGRMEHRQKRVTALIHMSDHLRVPHSLTLIGDGPAAPEVDSMIAGRAEIRRLAPLGPLSIAAMLEEHDALVLPSRYEGLSVSVLEAMAHGCIPILARTRSGAAQAIGHDADPRGLIVDVSEDAEEEEVGHAMAAAVTTLSTMDRAAMSRSAWARARDHFSLETHTDRIIAAMHAVIAEPPKPWPSDKPCAFTGAARAVETVPQRAPNAATGQPATAHNPNSTLITHHSSLSPSSGSVPADGPARMRALLDSLAGRSIVIHGTGEHTRQLKEVIVNAPVKIIAFTDDDRSHHGTRLWDWPVISPREAASRGVTDIVISSWMHQNSIWNRRAIYEGLGLKVWKVY